MTWLNRIARDHEVEAGDRALLRSFDDAVTAMERLSAAHVQCRIGCTACCVGVFEITALDAARIVRGVTALRTISGEACGAIVARAAEQWRVQARSFPGDRTTGILGPDERGREAFFARLDSTPCPALESASGACAIYPDRPLSCRSFGLPVRCGAVDLPPCTLSFRDARPEEVAACMVEPDPGDEEGALLELLRQRGVVGETTVATAVALWSAGTRGAGSVGTGA